MPILSDVLEMESKIKKGNMCAEIFNNDLLIILRVSAKLSEIWNTSIMENYQNIPDTFRLSKVISGQI